MSATQLLVLRAGLFFLFIFLSGTWLSRSGKPYPVIILTIHKLIGLAVGFFLVTTVYRVHQMDRLRPVETSAIAITVLFWSGIHPDFEDATRVDGANDWQVFTNVILPLDWPGFLTVGLVVALGTWGEYQLALIFVHKPELFPVTTSYSAFVSQFSRDWGLTSAAVIMMVAPVLIIFLSLQRQFIEGLTQGGVKLKMGVEPYDGNSF